MAREAWLCDIAPQRAQWVAGTVRRALDMWSLTSGTVGRRFLVARPTPAICAGSRAASSPCALETPQRVCASCTSTLDFTISDGFTS